MSNDYMSRVSDDLVAKEEEYHRLNAEIEQKTRMLVEEYTNLSMDREKSNIEEPESSLSHEELDLFEARSQSNLSAKSGKSPLPQTFATQHIERNTSPAAARNVLPPEARDLGPEATLRLLKAKVRVLEEEVERLTLENSKQKQSMTKNKQALDSEKEENAKLQKNVLVIRTQLEKYSTLAEEKKNQNKILENDLVKLRKDIDSMERADKKSSQSQKSIEVRLDRALEEAEKYKSLLSAARSRVSESSGVDKDTLSSLTNENKILHKQKAELINAYKKQMKLIDVLRKQKLHLEASRMLNFTQEEFMKVLDWKNAQ